MEKTIRRTEWRVSLLFAILFGLAFIYFLTFGIHQVNDAEWLAFLFYAGAVASISSIIFEKRPTETPSQKVEDEKIKAYGISIIVALSFIAFIAVIWML